MKKILLSLAAVGPAVCAFAEETSSSAIVTEAQSTLAGLLEQVSGVVGGLVTAGLVIWGGIALVGVLKRAFSAGKGR